MYSIYMFVHIYDYIHIHTYICTYAHTYMYIYIFMYIYEYALIVISRKFPKRYYMNKISRISKKSMGFTKSLNPSSLQENIYI
jgi:hypothetical protein